MRYYRSCLQRHLYLNGPDKILLSKATQLSGSIESIRAEFPDARIINILRNPVESIPSHISVFIPSGTGSIPRFRRMDLNPWSMPNLPPPGFFIWKNMTSPPNPNPTSAFLHRSGSKPRFSRPFDLPSFWSSPYSPRSTPDPDRNKALPRIQKFAPLHPYGIRPQSGLDKTGGRRPHEAL